ncbi:MAG: glycosyltransferase family 2 protein [Chitinophagaceae bacterium]|nr:MAG: glycosyltransferase family 2 protein [Chitinophagaceae bacterium]
MKFSLICVTYGRTDEVDRFLHSLQCQDSSDFEIIIIDQNQDNKIEHLVTKYNQTCLIRHVRVDFNNNTRARNLGIRLAKGEWIAFPDDDCWYDERLLTELANRIQHQPNVGGFFVNWADPLQEEKKIMFPASTGQMLKKELFEYAACICLFFRTDVLKQFGGFNEKLGLGDDTLAKAGEEQELLFRLFDNNISIHKALDLFVFHRINNRIWNSYFEQRVLGSGATDFYLISKHFGLFNGLKTLLLWTGGYCYNLVRQRIQYRKWYYLKLKGAFLLSGKLKYEPSRFN